MFCGICGDRVLWSIAEKIIYTHILERNANILGVDED